MGTKDFKYYLAGAVSLITFVVYLPDLQNEFLSWDDVDYVSENPHIRAVDLAFFRWAFFDFHASNWHPLTWISHALDYAVWGLNPMGHHLTSNILHTANTFLVVLLVDMLIEAALGKQPSSSQVAGGLGTGSTTQQLNFSPSRFTLIAAATTGLLFGLHPIHVESVAWVAERKDLLCALFFLLSIIKYMSYRTYMTYPSYFLSLSFFILALLSKPMAVTLPAVLLILDWYPFKRIGSMKSFWTAFIEKLPFIALSLASSILTILAQKTEGAIGVIPPTLSIRILTAANSLIAYLYKMAVPLDLIPFYPYSKDISLLSLKYGAAALLVVFITITCIAIAKKKRLWLTSWFYYVVTLLPVLGLVQVGTQSMADRYSYLPSLGPFLIVGLGGAWVSMEAFTVKMWRIISRLFTTAGAIIVLVLMSYLTFQQIAIWKDGVELWSYVIKKEPERVPTAYVNRGTMFYQTGQLDKAIADFDRAIELNPAYLRVHLNPAYYSEAHMKRGAAFEKMGRPDRALADYDEAIALNPTYFEAYNAKGLLYGSYYGAVEKAIEQFNKAIDIYPNYSIAHSNRGYAYSLLGQNDSALEDFNKAIKLDRNYAKNYLNRGNVCLKTGNKEQAISDFQRACELGEQGGCYALQSVRLP